MFLRIVKARGRKGEKHEYLRLVESYRWNGRTKQRVVANLGRKDLLTPHLDDLVRLLQGGARKDRCVSATELAPPQGGGVSPISLYSNRRAAILRRSPLFSDLDGEQLVELSRLTVERYLKAGQFIFTEGDPLECLYVVAEGRIKIVKHSRSGKDFVMAFCGPGAFFGTAVLLSAEAQPCSAQAVIDTTVLAIKYEDLLSFFFSRAELGFRILRRILIVVGLRLTDAMRRLAGLSGEKADQRLAYMLLTLSLEFGLALPFTREEIAQMAGTSTETAIRFVNHLKRAGVVHAVRRKITILDQKKLWLLIGDASNGKPHLTKSIGPGRLMQTVTFFH